MEATNYYLQKVTHVGNDMQAKQIRVFHTEESSVVADYVVLMTAKNNVHIKALCEELQKGVEVLQKDIPTDDIYEQTQLSGTPASGWMILDLNSIIVHIMSEDMRDFYALDKLFETKAVVFHH